MKAGDLIKWYKQMVASSDGETYFYEKPYPAIVLKDYEKHTKLLEVFVDGGKLVVHASECTLIKRGHKWKDTKKH